MTKTKRQLRAEAVERLKNCVAARFDAEPIVIALTSGRHGQSDWSLECDKLIYLLTDDANDDSAPESGVSDSKVNVTTESCRQHADQPKQGDDADCESCDSREKLEADVYKAAEEMEEFTHGEKFINTNKILRWLDRQASITEREVKERVNFSLITQTANALFPDYQARVAELQERVDSLTAEVEAQRKRANDAERGVLSEEWYVCRDRYEDDIAELTDERDELHEKLKRNAKDYLRTLIHLTAERDELKERVARFDSISSLDGIANLLIQFEDLTAERDKLREQLADKQHVCDVQRDSFLKLEAENRELQDVCGELERTIENLRGD